MALPKAKEKYRQPSSFLSPHTLDVCGAPKYQQTFLSERLFFSVPGMAQF
jgi:hypothetical protein